MARSHQVACALVVALCLQGIFQASAQTIRQTSRRTSGRGSGSSSTTGTVTGSGNFTSRVSTRSGSTFCRPGSVCADPIFLGFNGHRYEFHGEVGSSYNLISTSDVQVNARMIDLPVVKEAGEHATFFGVVGVVAGGLRISVESGRGHQLTVKVNNQELQLFDMAKEVIANNDDVQVMLYSRDGDVPDSVKIHTRNLHMGIIARGSHLDLVVEKVAAGMCEMHGVLGQTWTAGQVFDLENPLADEIVKHSYDVEGTAADYLVTDIFASNNKLSLFGKPCSQKQAQAQVSRKML